MMTRTRSLLSVALMALALLPAASGCTTVEPGEVGVETQWGTIQGGVRSPGWYTTVLSSVTRMSTRTETYTMAGPGTEGHGDGSVNVLAHDQLPVTLEVSVMFHLKGERAIDVFRVYGPRYADGLIHPLVRTAVRDAASEFSAVDLIDKRAQLQARMTRLIHDSLAAALRSRSVADDAVVVESILLRNIDLPQAIDDAIANVQRQRLATQAATQATETAQAQATTALATANGEAAALEARTAADARMLTVRTEAQARANRVLTDSITPQLIAWERANSLRAVLGHQGTRTVVLGGGGGTSPGLMLPSQ